MLTVEEIQQHFVQQLNHALRRPRLYDPPDSVLHQFVSSTAYVMEAGGEYEQWRGTLVDAGAFLARGVIGAVEQFLPSLGPEAAASVYADFIHQQGWLQLDRSLDAQQYGDLRGQYAEFCTVDRMAVELFDRFGEPSVRIGAPQPAHADVVGYSTSDEPPVWFYSSRKEQGVLLAARFGLEPLFVFTPEGERRQSEPRDPWGG